MPSGLSLLVIGTTFNSDHCILRMRHRSLRFDFQVKGGSLLQDNYHINKGPRMSMINVLSVVGLLALVCLFGLIFLYEDPLWDEVSEPDPELAETPKNVTIVSPSSDAAPEKAADPVTFRDPATPGDLAPDGDTAAHIVPDDPSMNDSEIARRRESISLSASYLINRITSNGSVTPKPQDILMNHAGAMYALGLYHDFQSSDETRSALLDAGEFLQIYGIAPLPKDDRLLEAWSRQELTATAGPVQAKLGGGGLGLVALLSMEKAAPGSTSLKKLQALARFILAMQQEDGSFSSDYIPPQDDRWDNWNPLDYPGEISLGLLMLYEHDSNSLWVAGATRALTHLAREREKLDEVPADHWSLLATARLFSLPENMVSSENRGLLIRHSIQVVEGILYDQIIISDSPLLIGGFSKDGRTSPTATRLEGLLAALEVIPENESLLRDQISKSVQRGMRFLINAQVLAGENAGGVPRAIRTMPVDGSGDAENFNRRAGEIRIEYVQHTLCAMIQYVEAFGSDQSRTALVED